MIDERLEELAGLYVLEALNPAEKREFEAALQHDAELRALVDSLRGVRDAVAGAVPPAEPSPRLKQRLMAEVSLRNRPASPEPRRQSPGGWLAFWLPWGMAAASVALAINLYVQKGELNRQVSQLDQLADSLRNTTNSLQQAVASLNETNRMDGLRIALLGTLLSDSPKSVAVSLWDNRQQAGVFMVQNLKPLPADRDYQLWVIDPQYPSPVSAGVFQVDGHGNVRFQFKAVKAIGAADKFAVTMEPKGGLPAPTMTNLVLVGG